METAEEKAKGLVDAIAFYKIELTAMHSRMIERAVTKLLKEQDRDTRHACANAVIDAVTDAHRDEFGHEILPATDAYTACMNVKAV